MNLKTHFHHIASPVKDKTLVEAIELIRNIKFEIEQGSSKKLREQILQAFHHCGWSGKVKLGPGTNISITAINGDYALCLQTGNMGRFYADLLKLQYLYQKKKIKAAIYVLPTKKSASALGSNLANFERMTNEILLFSETITIPMIIIGIE